MPLRGFEVREAAAGGAEPPITTAGRATTTPSDVGLTTPTEDDCRFGMLGSVGVRARWPVAGSGPRVGTRSGVASRRGGVAGVGALGGAWGVAAPGAAKIGIWLSGSSPPCGGLAVPVGVRTGPEPRASRGRCPLWDGWRPGGVVRGSDVPLIGEAACALCDGEDGGRTGAVGPLGGRPAGPPTGA